MTIILPTLFLLLTSLTLLILALPSPSYLTPNTSFSLPVTHQKCGSVMRRATTGSAAAKLASFDTYGKIVYTTPVTIGGQTVNLQFDTGSTILWVFGSSLPPGQKTNHETYDPAESSTKKDLHSTFNAHYVDDSGASGELLTDKMTVGGIEILTQVFGVASSVSEGFTDGPGDGVLGLSLTGVLPGSSYDSFVNNVIQVLDEPVFAAYLPHQSDGAYDFGEIRQDRYDGTIFYTPLVSDPLGFWKFESTEYVVNGVTYQSPGITAVVDTGAQLLFLQKNQVEQYYSAVPNAGYNAAADVWLYPCNQTLPDISLLVGPDNFATVPGANLVTGVKSGNGRLCVGGIQQEAESAEPRLNVYGLIFMSAFYCIFDVSVPQFGFAEIVPP